jgi:cytochrome c553
MSLRSVALLLVLICLCRGPSLSAQQKDAGRVAAEVCASCHGPRGDSASPAFPRLAGQKPEYIAAQLKAFRDRSRGDPMAQAFMWGMASQLSDDTIAGLAAYYASQKPLKATAADTKLVREGQIIFAQGIPTANVAPCQTCHGQQAEGNAAIPRLAGQHAEYMLKQLVLFKSSLRAGANAPIMHGVSNGMTFDQMEAAAAYAASR